MFMKVRLDEVVTAEMLVQHREHILAFLEQEGIAIDRDELGATQMTDRQVKELLEELAEESR